MLPRLGIWVCSLVAKLRSHMLLIIAKKLITKRVLHPIAPSPKFLAGNGVHHSLASAEYFSLHPFFYLDSSQHITLSFLVCLQWTPLECTSHICLGGSFSCPVSGPHTLLLKGLAQMSLTLRTSLKVSPGIRLHQLCLAGARLLGQVPWPSKDGFLIQPEGW